MSEKTEQQLILENEELRRRIAAMEDVEAQRKRAEGELAKNKAMLKATIECLPFDFFAIGADGRYVLENAVCRGNWGRLVGKTPAEMAPTEAVRALWLENNRRAFAGEKVEGVAAVTIKGEERIVYQVIAPIRDESESYGILGVNVDITQRKRAEEALQKARDELERRVDQRTSALSKANEELAIFRKFAEASGQGFSMADLDGRITYVNPARCRMLGDERPEDRVGRHLSTCYPEEINRRGEGGDRAGRERAGILGRRAADAFAAGDRGADLAELVPDSRRERKSAASGSGDHRHHRAESGRGVVAAERGKVPHARGNVARRGDYGRLEGPHHLCISASAARLRGRAGRGDCRQEPAGLHRAERTTRGSMPIYGERWKRVSRGTSSTPY